MISIFTSPKPFVNHKHTADIKAIQYNAIRSWQQLPGVDITLIANEEGVAEAAEDLGVKHYPDIIIGPGDMPMLDDVLEKIDELAIHNIVCLINTDIILTGRVAEAIDFCKQYEKFLLMGRRHNFTVGPLDFNENWQGVLDPNIINKNLQQPNGIDYFIYNKGLYTEKLDISMRMGWDGWLLYQARALGATLVNATRVIHAIHQAHDRPAVGLGYEVLDTIGAAQIPGANKNAKKIQGRVLHVTAADVTLYREMNKIHKEIKRSKHGGG